MVAKIIGMRLPLIAAATLGYTFTSTPSPTVWRQTTRRKPPGRYERLNEPPRLNSPPTTATSPLRLVPNNPLPYVSGSTSSGGRGGTHFKLDAHHGWGYVSGTNRVHDLSELTVPSWPYKQARGTDLEHASGFGWANRLWSSRLPQRFQHLRVGNPDHHRAPGCPERDTEYRSGRRCRHLPMDHWRQFRGADQRLESSSRRGRTGPLEPE